MGHARESLNVRCFVDSTGLECLVPAAHATRLPYPARIRAGSEAIQTGNASARSAVQGGAPRTTQKFVSKHPAVKMFQTRGMVLRRPRGRTQCMTSCARGSSLQMQLAWGLLPGWSGGQAQKFEGMHTGLCRPEKAGGSKPAALRIDAHSYSLRYAHLSGTRASRALVEGETVLRNHVPMSVRPITCGARGETIVMRRMSALRGRRYTLQIGSSLSEIKYEEQRYFIASSRVMSQLCKWSGITTDSKQNHLLSGLFYNHLRRRAGLRQGDEELRNRPAVHLLAELLRAHRRRRDGEHGPARHFTSVDRFSRLKRFSTTTNKMKSTALCRSCVYVFANAASRVMPRQGPLFLL